jgi:zinc transport system substrate-binding protein
MQQLSIIKSSQKIIQPFLFFFCLFASLIFLSPLAAEEALSRQVLVSVAPYKFFVDQISGGTVQVKLMVPAGASAHTYEPSAKEMLAVSKADLWFVIGESFEGRAVRALKSHHPQLQIVDLRRDVDLISSDPHHQHTTCHGHNCQDLHIWLSPRQSQIQARTIAAALSTLYPENQKIYQDNLEKFLVELKRLDHEMTQQLATMDPRVILVSHPAYGYLCRDYHIQQLSIEFEGRDPTPKQLTNVINQARHYGIKKIYTQIQYSNKGARLIAAQLGAEVVSLDPYSENYMASMREIAAAFASRNSG